MNRRAVNLILCAILLAWTAAVFLPVRHFDFLNWDDYDEAVENPLLHPPSVEHLRQIWSGPHLRLYAPLSYTVWWTLAQISGALSNPGLFHLLNIFLHLASVLLVFSILSASTKSPIPSFGGALIFALHPIQVETIGWIAEMNNLLAAALSLGAIRLYLAFRTTTGKNRWIYFAFALATYLLALFSKPTAVVVPFIAAILDLGFLHGSPRKILRNLSPWLIASGIFAWIARAAQQVSPTPLLHRPLVAIDAVAFYCGKLVWPANLTIDYGRTPERVLFASVGIADLLVLVVLAVTLWLMWRNHRGVSLGALILVVALLPVLGLIPFTFQEFSTVADHFLYLAMLGPALIVATLLQAAGARWALPLTASMGITLAVLSAAQLHVWQNSDALIKHTFAIDPQSTIGHAIAGAVLDRAGRPAEAIPHFAAASAADPANIGFHHNLANAMNNLGVQYAKMGRRDLAIDEFRHVLEIDPHNPQAMQNLQIMDAGVPSN